MQQNKGAKHAPFNCIKPKVIVTDNPPQRRALIVEDEYEFQQSLGKALEQIRTLLRLQVYSRGQDAIDFISNFSGHLDVALVDLTRQCDKRARAFDILCSIPGLGRVTAVAILIECPEIGTMTAKQVASLAGLAPMTRQSGQWRGKAFIQGERKFLRDSLYMPALVASRYNPDLRQKYQTMVQAGKPAKVAPTALMRKLIELANALVRQDRKWTPKTA